MSMTPDFTPQRPLRIGTRQSPLAMAQAHMAADALIAAHGLAKGAVQLVPMIATGDKVLDRPLADVGGKALWTKELDRALDAGEIDVAVHSMKDVETLRPGHFTIAAMLPRADARDRLIGAASLTDLPPSAVVGSASPRRRAQLLRARSDLDVRLIRGNVATRLAQVESGAFAATLLAAAGLNRLGQGDMGVALPLDAMLPAPSQGAVGIECRADVPGMVAFVAAVDDAATSGCVWAERRFLAALTADCHSPVAAHAVIEGDGQLWLRAEILSADGAECVAGEVRCAFADADAPAALARRLLAKAGPAITALFTGA